MVGGKSCNTTNVLNFTKTCSRSLVSATVLRSKAHLLTKFKDRQCIGAETQIATKIETSTIVASKVEICAILKRGMRKLEICGSFKFAHAILKLFIAF